MIFDTNMSNKISLSTKNSNIKCINDNDNYIEKVLTGFHREIKFFSKDGNEIKK